MTTTEMETLHNHIKHYVFRQVATVWCLFVLLAGKEAAAQANSSYYDRIKQVTESGATPLRGSLSHGLESPVNTLTGAACFDIPIYTIKTGGHSLPVSMHYETSGFKMVDLASNVGMGWSVSASGVINRTVKGLPDETHCVGYTTRDDLDSIHGADSIHGLISELSRRQSLDTIVDDLDNSLFVTLMGITDNAYDAEPDIYSFSFAGYSGSFVHDMDGGIHLIPEQNFEIQETGDSLVITVDNGDKYYFGGGYSTETVRLTFNCPLFEKVSLFELNQLNETHNYYHNRYFFYDNQFTRESSQNYPISWNLTRIEFADSGAEVRFEYDLDTVQCYMGSDETYMMGQRFSDLISMQFENGHDWVVQRVNRYRFAYVPRLRRIIWDNGTIDFIPSAEYREDMNFQEDQNPRTYGGRSIDRIVVSSMDNENGVRDAFKVDLKKHYFVDFNATLTPPNGTPIKFRSYYKRLCLDSIVFKGLDDAVTSRYSFIYYRKSQSYCCSRNTCEIDWWGYYKPRQAVNIERMTMKPRLYYYSNGKDNPLYNSVYSVWRRPGNIEPDCVLEGNDDMEPDPVGAQEFTLRGVVLPTGGMMEFVYEPNDFLFDGVTRTGPGVRVKYVNYGSWDNQENGYKHRFYYTDGSQSSGRISSIPNIGHQNHIALIKYGDPTGSSDCYRLDFSTARQVSTVTDMRGLSDATVHYTRVKEVCENNYSNLSLGSTVHINHVGFTVSDTALMEGDRVFVRKTKVRRSRVVQYIDNDYFVNPFQHVSHIDNTPDFTYPIVSWYNDFPIKTEYYDGAGRLVESVEHKYSLFPKSDSVFYIQSKYHAKEDIAYEYHDPIYEHDFIFPMYQYDVLWGVNYYKTGVRHLDTVIHKRYGDSGQLANVLTNTYDYNGRHYISMETAYDSDGDETVSHYSYPFQYADWSTDTVYRQMTRRNMVNGIVEHYKTVHGKVVEGVLNRYASFGSGRFVKPDQILTLRTAAPLTDFQQLSQNGMDSRYKPLATLGYDPASGNIVTVLDESEGLTVYVWGGRHGWLLAKVRNATRAEVESSLGCTQEALQEITDPDVLIGVFQALRTTLPNAMVTSYTYDLFGNLTSVTDASGRTNRFEYDSGLRLRLTRDSGNNIMKMYEYHYKN